MATEPSQRSYRAPCPGCGAPVDFKSAQSTHAVCGFCQSTVVRDGETLKRLGAQNIVTADLGPFPKLNPEFIVRANPDVILIGQRSADGLQQRPGWQGIRALRDEVSRLSSTECARAVDALRAEIAWRMECDARAARPGMETGR